MTETSRRNATLTGSHSGSLSIRSTGVHRRQDTVDRTLPGTPVPVLPAVIVVSPQLGGATLIDAPVFEHAAHILEPAVAPAGKPDARRFAVGAYRFAGLSILTVLVTLLLAYIASQVFYFFSTSWVAPNTIMPGDVKAVAMQTELSARKNERDALAAQLVQAEATVAMNQRFQIAFVHSVRADLGRRRTALAQLTKLSATAHSTTGAARGTMTAYAAQNQKFLDAELQAGLIKRDQIMGGNFATAQVKAQTIGMAEQQAEIDIQADEVARETASLDAILDDTKRSDGDGLAYDILKIEQQYMQSKAMLNSAIAVRDQLVASVAREDALIHVLESSVYVRALTDKAFIAFVPYDNLAGAKPDAWVYSCKLGFLVCHRVGTVRAVLPGEIVFTHPHRDKQMRGQAVELDLLDDEADAAQDDALFVGGKPFLF